MIVDPLGLCSNSALTIQAALVRPAESHKYSFFLGHIWRSSGRQGLVNLTCPTMTAALWSFGGPSGDGDISLRGGHGNLQFSSVYIHNASSTTVLLQKYIQEWMR